MTNFKHDDVCAKCGKRYGKHYGLRCELHDKKDGFVLGKRGIDYHAMCYNCGNYYGNHYNGLCSEAHNSTFFVPARKDKDFDMKLTRGQAKGLIDDVVFYFSRAFSDDLPKATLMELWKNKGYIAEED